VRVVAVIEHLHNNDDNSPIPILIHISPSYSPDYLYDLTIATALRENR